MYYLSATSIKDFIDCSKKYYWRTTKAEEAVTTPEMKAGLIVHEVIEKYWDKPKVHNLQKGLHLAEGAKLPDKLIERVEYCINTYHDTFRSMLTPEDEKEISFKVKLEDEVTLVGRIDRITKPANLVIDWKTSEGEVTNIDNDIQFLIYYYAYTKMYKHPPSGVYYASLLHKQLITLHIDRSNYTYLIGDVLPGMINQIKNNNYYREGLFRSKCLRCQFREVCLGK
jgi:CRISPR/Cas system-associated exonuclease Cas4 (RecB family)